MPSRLCLTLVMALTLSGCLLQDPGPRAYLERAPDGELCVAIVACNDTEVVSDASLGVEGKPPTWRITLSTDKQVGTARALVELEAPANYRGGFSGGSTTFPGEIELKVNTSAGYTTSYLVRPDSLRAGTASGGGPPTPTPELIENVTRSAC